MHVLEPAPNFEFRQHSFYCIKAFEHVLKYNELTAKKF